MTDLKLTLVGTPIGNLEDLSIRAIKALHYADVIVCEDTRRTGQLLKLIEDRLIGLVGLENTSKPQLISYRDQNHEAVFPLILVAINSGKNVILVSDSGMPAISDPGFKLVRDLINNQISIDVIPGPTAFATAASISGLPTDKICFLGFLPKKSGQIIQTLTEYGALDATLVLYESPFRVSKTLELVKQTLGEERFVSVVYELTKVHQRRFTGRVEEVIQQLKTKSPKGEVVILIAKEDYSFT